MDHPAAISERSRRNGIREGAFQAIMVGGGENYLSAFALLLHASAFQIGLLSALPQLVGTWAQLFSVKVLNRFHHRKALILVGAAGQAAVRQLLLGPAAVAPAAAAQARDVRGGAHHSGGHHVVL